MTLVPINTKKLKSSPIDGTSKYVLIYKLRLNSSDMVLYGSKHLDSVSFQNVATDMSFGRHFETDFGAFCRTYPIIKQ